MPIKFTGGCFILYNFITIKFPTVRHKARSRLTCSKNSTNLFNPFGFKIFNFDFKCRCYFKIRVAEVFRNVV